MTAAPHIHSHRFSAMASPCEIKVETDDADLASMLSAAAEAEARRIEEKFTRYRATGIVSRINCADGAPVEVDEETAGLIAYAAQVHALSEGRFDITSGVLRRVWTFDGSDRVPHRANVESVLPLVGWHKVRWESPVIHMPPGMEIDLGGICKEYAVDRAARAIALEANVPAMVNFGGDLATTGAKSDGRWRIAIESLDPEKDTGGVLHIAGGAIATRGDAPRYYDKLGNFIAQGKPPTAESCAKPTGHEIRRQAQISARSVTRPDLLKRIYLRKQERKQTC